MAAVVKVASSMDVHSGSNGYKNSQNGANHGHTPYQNTTSRMTRTPSSKLRKHSDTARTEKEQGYLVTQLGKAQNAAASDESEYDTDLEDEEPRRTPVHAQKTLYVKMCKTYGTVPASFYLRNMEKERLSVVNKGLGPRGVKAMAAALQINGHVTDLSLEGNAMGAEGCRHVAFMLQENVFISKLNLSYNCLERQGARYLCSVLLNNKKIEALDLSGNSFEDKDAGCFCQLLQENTTLRELILSNNNFRELGAAQLGKGLAKNSTLEKLDLSWNHIRLRGADAIAAALKNNTCLEWLNLSMNGLSTDSAHSLCHALSSNTTLRHLDVSSNRIGSEGCKFLAQALHENTSLRTLRMGLNPVTPVGALALITALDKNENSSLHELNLRGITVTEQFMQACAHIRLRRSFEVEVGHVIRNFENESETTREGDATATGNPLEILLTFMSDNRLRLIDLFNGLDRDQSGTLTRDEFRRGLSSIETPLSESQLTQLINMLDKDGDEEIDLREMFNIHQEFRDVAKKVQRQRVGGRVEGPNDKVLVEGASSSWENTGIVEKENGEGRHNEET